jgi:hypothetical protein
MSNRWYCQCPAAVGVFQVEGKLPFDKLRANGQAFSFALSREPGERSKGKFAPKLKWTRSSPLI